MISFAVDTKSGERIAARNDDFLCPDPACKRHWQFDDQIVAHAELNLTAGSRDGVYIFDSNRYNSN